MNDDALPPEFELASAYLDGEVDEDERAQVEGSPELAAMVASFRDLRGALAGTPTSDPVAREAAVAAALAEFDVLHAAPAAAAFVAAPPNVVTLHPNEGHQRPVQPRAGQPRTRWSRVVMGAAAALLIGGVSVAAINSFGSGSDDSASSATVPTPKLAGAEEAADTASGGDATAQTINAINGAASPVPEIDEPEQLLTLTAAAPPVDDATESSTADATQTAAATETAPATESSTVTTSAKPDGTEATASGVTSATAAPTGGVQTAPATRAATSFAFDCPLTANQVILLEISWRGTPAVAVRDTVTGVIQAIDAQCNVLASAP